MSEALEKLRKLEQWIRSPEGKSFTLTSDIFDEVADEIERLRAETERLRAHAERADAADARAKRLENVAEAVEAQNTRLEAENERLQQALEFYAEIRHWTDSRFASLPSVLKLIPSTVLRDRGAVARAALAKQEGK